MIQTIDTDCPTCGAKCTIEGRTTHYYKHVNTYSEKDVEELLYKLNDQINETSGELGLGPNSMNLWFKKNKKKA